MDYETFPTKRDALTKLAALVGWPDATIEQLYSPDHPHANHNGNVWVVSPERGKYLRDDGYVR